MPDTLPRVLPVSGHSSVNATRVTPGLTHDFTDGRLGLRERDRGRRRQRREGTQVMGAGQLK